MPTTFFSDTTGVVVRNGAIYGPLLSNIAHLFLARNAERVYMIGGSTDQRNPEKASTAVTRICLSRSFVRRAASLPVATWRPAVTTAPNMIAVCGGTSDGVPLPNCQVYPRKTDKYAGLLETILASMAPPPSSCSSRILGHSFAEFDGNSSHHFSPRMKISYFK